MEETTVSENPDWLEAFRLPDSLLASAYDNFGAEGRSLIKTAIALAHFHFSQRSASGAYENLSPNLGFFSRMEFSPAEWTLLIFPEKFDAAALACAATVLPVICNVSRILAVSLDRMPAPALLASLELCGIEDIFRLDPDVCGKLVTELSSCPCVNKNVNPGRILSLEYRDSPSILPALAKKTKRLPPFRRLDASPVVCLEKPDVTNRNLLHLMLGAALQIHESPEACDAFYGNPEHLEELHIRGNCMPQLFLPMPCAGFWLFSNLTPDFFQLKRQSFTLIDACF